MPEPQTPALSGLGAGDLVTPTVRLVRPLAEGGMGRVWVADHLGLHTQVVVKLMSEEMLARPDGSDRFANEAAAAAAIKSPHVVQVFDHGLTEGGIPYIVMELLEGQDLAGYLADHGRMAPDQAMALVVQVGRALTKAHKAGIVHRDIKPDNIFLCDTRDARDPASAPDTSGPFPAIDADVEVFVKLLDFGTAKRDEPAVARTTVPGQIMGTPYYMSPEQSIGAELDERSDIWSLGVVVFEALTGHKPFDGASLGAIALAIHGVTPKLSAILPDLPPAIDAWFEHCCAHKPEQRFTTVREASVAFVEAVTGVAPADQPTESVFFPPVVPRSSKPPMTSPHGATGERTPMRPVSRSMPPLKDTLGERTSERRVTTIAAGAVMAIAALAMVAIVMHRSPDPTPEPAAKEAVVAAKAPEPPPPPPPVPAPAPEPAPAKAPPKPIVAAKDEPAPAREAASKPVAAGTPTHEKKHATAALPPAKPTSKHAGKDAGAPTPGHEDDDLLRLQNAAPKPDPAPVEPPLTPTPTPTTAPPALPTE